MKNEKITFQNKDNISLKGILTMPVTGKPKAFALFAHCFTCNKNLKAINNISQGLLDQNIAILRFDFTGLGESEGDFADTNFSSNVDDLVSAADYLKNNYKAPCIIIGHSLGGSAVLEAAGKIESVQAIATIGAPFDPLHVTEHFNGTIEEIKDKGEAKVSIGGRPFMVKKQFLEDLESVKLEDHIHALKKPLLVMHSPSDNVVGIENAEKIYKAAYHPKSFISLAEADHLLMKKEDSLYVGQMISSWVARYVQFDKDTSLDSDMEVVTRTEDQYTTEIKADNHFMIADEPKKAGGNDFGANPYGYLLSGLGACTGMTLRMYADRKEWPLKEVRVHLRHQKVHASDCENCDTKQDKLDKIDRIIEIEGELDNSQRKRLMEIADKCPVHRTLSSDIWIDSHLKEEQEKSEKST